MTDPYEKARRNGTSGHRNTGMAARVRAALERGPLTRAALLDRLGDDRKASSSAIGQMLTRTGGIIEVVHNGTKKYALAQKKSGQPDEGLPPMKPLRRDLFSHQSLAMEIRRG